ncbi:MAG: methyltransferase [Thermoplasmatales archaeon]
MDVKSRRKVLAVKYGSILILWLAVFTILQVFIIPLVLYFRLNMSGYLLLALPLTIPIAFTLTYSSRQVRLYPARVLFKYLIEPDLKESTESMLRTLDEPSGLERAMDLLGKMFHHIDIVSDAFGMNRSEIETGKRVLQLLQNLIESDGEDTAYFFRIPRLFSNDFLNSLVNESFVEHWVSEELIRHGEKDVILVFVTYCLEKFLENEHVGRSARTFDDVNKILQYIASIQNGPINYESVEIWESMKRLAGMLKLFVFYMYIPGGGNLISNHRVLIERNLLHWISLVDYSTRASDFVALEEAPNYFYNLILKDDSSKQVIIRRLAEEIKSDPVLDVDIFFSLRAFAKLSIDSKKKLDFILRLHSKLNNSNSPDINRLLENIEFYLQLVEEVAHGGRDSDTMDSGLRCDIEPAGEATWRVEFHFGDSEEIVVIEESLLLFDVNSLAKKGVLERLESLSKKKVTEVAIKLKMGKELKIKCWPFGVTSEPTNIMGVWPPTVDSASFLKVLRDHGYFDKSYGNIADIGCGAGMLGLSFLNYAEVKNVAFSDVNPVALDWVSFNATLNGIDLKKVSLVRGRSLDWAIKSKTKYDLILLSPPYLPSFLTRSPAIHPRSRQLYDDIVNEYSIETVDTGLLYDAIVNFKLVGEKLVVLYSSIADDVVINALRDVTERGIDLSEKVLYEKLVPLKLPGVVPSDMKEYQNWPMEKIDPLDDLKRRGRLFNSPESTESTYPFWQKIKVVEFS